MCVMPIISYNYTENDRIYREIMGYTSGVCMMHINICIVIDHNMDAVNNYTNSEISIIKSDCQCIQRF